MEGGSSSSSFKMPTVIKKTEMARRYVKCHHEFVTYEEITNYLRQLLKEFPGRLTVEIAGESRQGRDIYLVGLSKNRPFPSISTIIEAGCNAEDWYSVSTALYIIDYLVRDPKALLLMDYYIIPCLNPDAYEYLHKRRDGSNRLRSPPQTIDLTRMFPIVKDALAKSASFGNKRFEPEIVTIARVLEKYKFCARMFISLREGGRKLYFPWGFCDVPAPDYKSLREVAYVGKKYMGQDMKTGILFEKNKDSSGNAIDYIKLFFPPIKFVYIMQFSNDEERLPDSILEKGVETWEAIRAMARRVYKFYRSGLSNHFELKTMNI